MDLILWRHAEAEDGFPDLARELTAKGRKQAAQMAGWLQPRLPDGTHIVASPAARTRQTTQALGKDFETLESLAPGASYAALLSAVDWPQRKGTVLVVGHQPTLGHVVSMLLTGEPGDWNIKKGAVFWLRHRDRGESAQVLLRAALSPDLA